MSRLPTITSSLLLAVLLAGGCKKDENQPPTEAGTRRETSVTEFGGRLDGCANLSQKAELPPLDMLLVLDTSGSMDYKLKWPSIKSALKAFVTDPKFATLGMGVQYFPLRAQCKADDYAVPAVPIAPLAVSAPDIVKSLDDQRMSGGTPMVPMLTGVMTYMRKWAEAQPDRRVVIILATDGIPDDTCIVPSGTTLPNTLTNAVAVATDGFTQKPSVPTFVIGVGSELAALNQIAQGGGTTSAFLVDTSQDIQASFLQALNDIRRNLACEYKLPPPPGGEVGFDYAAVQIRYTVGSKSEFFMNIGAETGCATAPDKGWYYDVPKKPKKIFLCPQTCKKAQGSDGGQVDLIFPCRAIPS